jgi:MFS family permease
MAIAGALAAPLVGTAVDRTGQTAVLVSLGVANPLAWLALILVGTLSPDAPVLLCAAVALTGTAVFAAAPSSRSWRSSHVGARRRAAALRAPGMPALLASGSLFGIAFGAGEIGLPALAEAIGAPSAKGLLLALWCFGSLLAGVLYGARAWRAPLPERCCACLLLFAVSMAPLVLADTLTTAIVLSVIAGVGQPPTLTCR